MSKHSTHDVLVVGAGPAGLTTAVALARHGIDVLVVERHAGTSPFPKATGVSTRTMEVLRSWGLDQQARAGGMRVRPVISVSDTLIGPEHAAESFNYPTAEQALAVSPTTPAYLPQDHLEPVLLGHLVERGGTVRFHTEVTDLQITEHGVRAQLRDRRTGHLAQADTRFVVGADGPRSTVRAALGIDYEALGTIGDYVAVIFRSELAERLPRVPGVVNSVQTPAGPGCSCPPTTTTGGCTAGSGRMGRSTPMTGRTSASSSSCARAAGCPTWPYRSSRCCRSPWPASWPRNFAAARRSWSATPRTAPRRWAASA